MIRFLTSHVSLLFACSFSASTLAWADELPLDPQPGSTYESGQWRYSVSGPALDSAHYHSTGHLYLKNRLVRGNLDDRLNTDLGDFQWQPDACSTELCGWYPIDPKRKYSRWQRVEIDEMHSDQEWITRRIKPSE